MGPRMANAMNRARAWLMLALGPDAGPGRARRLVERFGSPEAGCALSRSPLAAAGVAAAALDGWSRAGELAARELGRLARLGASLRVWDDPGYPARLRAIADPPLTIAVRGTLEADELAVAVVGARRAGVYGRGGARGPAPGPGAAGARGGSGSGGDGGQGTGHGDRCGRPWRGARRRGADGGRAGDGRRRGVPALARRPRSRGGRERRPGLGVHLRHAAPAASLPAPQPAHQ